MWWDGCSRWGGVVGDSIGIAAWVRAGARTDVTVANMVAADLERRNLAYETRQTRSVAVTAAANVSRVPGGCR